MEPKIKETQNEKNDFIYEIAETIAMEMENVDEIKHLPLKEVCIPKFIVKLKDGTEYLVSVVRADKK